MPSFPRYAIYFAPPPDDALAAFGAQTLGYDPRTGTPVPFAADLEAAISDWRGLTADPRVYGFHATLKAPFALALGQDAEMLHAACRRFSETSRVIPVIEPVVRSIGAFVAIVPSEPVAALQALAADCVREFDGFRAPLAEADRARRKPDALSPAQVALLDRWGYPYVFEEFRFHMTLTGRLPAERREHVRMVLDARFAALNLRSLPIDRIALFKQDAPGANFRIRAHYPLTPAG